MIKNIIASYRHIPYTLKHYLAFLKTEKQLLGHYIYKFHDWDKLGMYIFLPWLGPDKISEIHRKSKSHHLRPKKDNPDYLEAVIDWECARYTKPDKPLNARDTLNKFYPEFKNEVEPVLEKLGL